MYATEPLFPEGNNSDGATAAKTLRDAYIQNHKPAVPADRDVTPDTEAPVAQSQSTSHCSRSLLCELAGLLRRWWSERHALYSHQFLTASPSHQTLQFRAKLCHSLHPAERSVFGRR